MEMHTKNWTDTYLTMRPTYSGASEARSHGGLPVRDKEGLSLIIRGLISLIFLRPILIAIRVYTYLAVGFVDWVDIHGIRVVIRPSIAALSHCCPKIRRTILRILDIPGHLSNVRATRKEEHGGMSSV